MKDINFSDMNSKGWSQEMKDKLMKRFLILGLFNVIGSMLCGMGFTGLLINLLCYLCNKAMLFTFSVLTTLIIIGLVMEVIGFALFVICKKD